MNNFVFTAMRRPPAPDDHANDGCTPIHRCAPHTLRSPGVKGLSPVAFGSRAASQWEGAGNKVSHEWWDPGFSKVEWGGDDSQWWDEIGNTLKMAAIAPVTTFQLIGQALNDAFAEGEPTAQRTSSGEGHAEEGGDAGAPPQDPLRGGD